MKKEQAEQLYKEIQEFISGIDVEFRKNLLKAIGNNFLIQQFSNGQELITSTDYRTGYFDKYKEIQDLLGKALHGGYGIELWEHCMMDHRCTCGDFIVNELRLSLAINTNKKSDFPPLDDGDE